MPNKTRTNLGKVRHRRWARYSTGRQSEFKLFVHGPERMAESSRTRMMQARAYLDHNATTPMRPAAADAFARALLLVGNPSSIHAEGRAARAAMDRARHQVAAAVGGEAKGVIFTSGATEALNMVLRPSPAIASSAGARRTDHLLVLATEHGAALFGGGFSPERTERIPVTPDGVADLDWLARRLGALAEGRGAAPVTVAIQLANSETGVIQPVADASRLTAEFGSLLVCDAVAGCGKIPLDIKSLGADALVVSAHKFGGAKGVGAVILHGDRLQMAKPLLTGGGQEMRRRSGTENVAGIVAMGAAAQEASAQLSVEAARIVALRERLLMALRASRPDLAVFGENAPRLPNTLNIGAAGLTSETAVIAFDLAGVAISSGSACSSGKVKRSHVLDAMGVPPDLADSALRFSLGWTTTEADIDAAAAVFGRVARSTTKAAA
jgi:cysteine desulfurase